MTSGKSATTSTTRRLTGPFKWRCNVHYVSLLNGSFVHQAVHKHESSKPSGGMRKLGHRVTIYSRHFLWLAVDHVVVVTSDSTLVESWFTFYPLLAPNIADTIILYSCTVFNHHVSRSQKFTDKCKNTLHDHFWWSTRMYMQVWLSFLHYVLLIVPLFYWNK